MAFEQLGQAVPVEERELGWDDTIEKAASSDRDRPPRSPWAR